MSLVILALSIAASWGLAWVLGGAGNVAPHWFYVPVIFAGLRFGPIGAIITAVVATLVAGPLLPADVGMRAPQEFSDWLSRGIFFLLLGVFVTQLFAYVRRSAVRERALVEEQRVGQVQATVLRESEQRFRALVQRASDMITVIDGSGRIAYESPAVERILGWPAAERVGMRCGDTLHPDDRERFAAVFADVAAHPERSHAIEVRQSDSNNEWHWVEAMITNLTDEPTVRGSVINYRLVDERKALEAQLTHRAFHDTLTNLANRALFHDRVGAALSRRDVDVSAPAVLFIDVDDFKTVNDEHGHEAGDHLLAEVAERLRRCVRPEDLVARLGGDEFAVLVSGSAAAAVTASGVSRRVLTSMKDPFAVGEHTVSVDVSIGIACHEKGEVDTDQFLRRADIAMYHAKAEGKGRFSLFSSAMSENVRKRNDAQAELRAAVANHEIAVHYQPIVTMTDARIVGIEALVRWDHPTRGLLAPSEFLLTAEDTGLIVPIGHLVFATALGQLRQWQRSDPRYADLTMSINLSLRQLQSDTVTADIDAAIATAGIEPRTLIVEVAEGDLFDETEGVVEVLQQLRRRGILIAIDNLDSGESSLSRLTRIPVDYVKVDRSSVGAVRGSASEWALVRVRGVLRVARELRLLTVAEGIEDPAQEMALRELGCDQAQGYLYARACDAQTITDLLGGGDLATHFPLPATASA